MNDKLNKEQFESLYEKQPPRAVWERIEGQIEDKSRRGGMTWRTLLSAAAVLLIGVSLWFWNQPGEAVIAEAPSINEQAPISTVEDPIASVEGQNEAQNTASAIEKASVEKAHSTQVALVEGSNSSFEEEASKGHKKLPRAATEPLAVRQTEVVAEVKLERRFEIGKSLVKLPQAEMEIKTDSKAKGQLVKLQSDRQPQALAVKVDKKPTLRFRGLTTTETALYIVKDELDHIAGDVVMAGKKKLKDFNIQF